MNEIPGPNNEIPDRDRELLAPSELSPIPEVMQRLRAALPELASGLVTRSQDMSDPANVSFAADPDNPSEHGPSWHQYGVLTHSQRFGEALQTAVPTYIDRWGLAEPVQSALAEEIDGTSKEELLQVAGLVHDVGKFTARTIHRDSTGALSGSLDGHEEHSGRIVRQDLSPALGEWGLSGPQIEYVARCAELHFELGKVRRTARSGEGYTIAFTESPAFEAAAQEIIDASPEFALEIGLEFMADSLSKTEVASTGETDEQIARERPTLEAELAAKGLNPKLINQAVQVPVNMKVARAYLMLLFRDR